MKKNYIKKYSDMLDQDIIPETFNYCIDYFNITDIDFDFDFDTSKVSYNIYYNSFDFYCKKFPMWESIPGFDLVIQDIANTSLLPLEEMIERNNIKSTEM